MSINLFLPVWPVLNYSVGIFCCPLMFAVEILSTNFSKCTSSIQRFISCYSHYSVFFHSPHSSSDLYLAIFSPLVDLLYSTPCFLVFSLRFYLETFCLLFSCFLGIHHYVCLTVLLCFKVFISNDRYLLLHIDSF